MKNISLEKLADILDKNRNKPISDIHLKLLSDNMTKLGKKYIEDEKKSIPTQETINSQFTI